MVAKRDMAVPVETRVGHVQESEDTLASVRKPQLYNEPGNDTQNQSFKDFLPRDVVLRCPGQDVRNRQSSLV